MSVTLARRFGGAGMRRGIRRVSGGADSRILLFADGTFARSSGGTYLTSATSIVTAGSNVLRLEDRGDGNGPLALLEGAATNLLDHRRPSNFSNKGSVVINALAGTSLLDGRTQDTVDFGLASPNHQIFDNTGRATTAQSYAHSIWYKFLSGTNTDFVFYPQITSPDGEIRFFDSPTDWTYKTDSAVYGVNGIGQIYRDVAIETKTIIVDCQQLETGKFPTSYVDVNGATASRVADSLTFASGDYPARMANGRWKFHFYPYFANDEVDSDVVLLSFGGADDELRYVASTDKFEVFTSGVSRGASSALTFSRHQKLTLTLDWPARELTISGATTGNGTVSLTSTDEWPSTGVTLRIGGRQGGALECFGRYTEPEVA